MLPALAFQTEMLFMVNFIGEQKNYIRKKYYIHAQYIREM
jgi:hypothetical protein